MGETNETNETDDVTDWIPFNGTVAGKTWVSPGYWEVYILGPTTTYLSILLQERGNSKEMRQSGKGGRAHIRKEAKKKARIERHHGSDRGFDIKTKVQVAGIAQNEDASAMRARETRFAAISTQIRTTENKIERLNRRLDRAEKKGKQEEAEEIEELIEDEESHLDSLESELEELKNEEVKKNPIVTKVIEQAADMMGVKVGSTSTEQVAQMSNEQQDNGSPLFDVDDEDSE